MAVIHAPTPVAPPPAPVQPMSPPIDLLLVEPQFLVRRTVAAVARDMRLANPQEITTVEAAARLVAVHAFDALFLSLDEEGPALDLMSRVRNGETRCNATIPIAVTASACNTALALQLKNLEVRRLLLRPFKVKGVLDAIVALRPAPGATLPSAMPNPVALPAVAAVEASTGPGAASSPDDVAAVGPDDAAPSATDAPTSH